MKGDEKYRTLYQPKLESQKKKTELGRIMQLFVGLEGKYAFKFSVAYLKTSFVFASQLH